MKKGLTLIELIITTALVSVLIGVFCWLLLAGFRTWVSGKTRADMVQSADRAMETMTRWISVATSITAASANSITFTGDIDNDSMQETVSFSLSGTNLQRTVGGTAITMAPNTQTLSFTYVNSAGAPIVPADQAARDTIRLVNVSATTSASGETVTLKSGVFCRNR